MGGHDDRDDDAGKRGCRVIWCSVERRSDLRNPSTGLSYGCKAKQGINGRSGVHLQSGEFRFWGTGPV